VIEEKNVQRSWSPLELKPMMEIDPDIVPMVEKMSWYRTGKWKTSLRDIPTKEAISLSAGMAGIKIMIVHFVIGWYRRGRNLRSSSETNKYRKSVYKRSGRNDVDAAVSRESVRHRLSAQFTNQ